MVVVVVVVAAGRRARRAARDGPGRAGRAWSAEAEEWGLDGQAGEVLVTAWDAVRVHGRLDA